jgi:hypothetical protein
MHVLVEAELPVSPTLKRRIGMERDHRRLEALKQVLEAFSRHDLDAIMSH